MHILNSYKQAYWAIGRMALADFYKVFGEHDGLHLYNKLYNTYEGSITSFIFNLDNNNIKILSNYIKDEIERSPELEA